MDIYQIIWIIACVSATAWIIALILFYKANKITIEKKHTQEQYIKLDEKYDYLNQQFKDLSKQYDQISTALDKIKEVYKQNYFKGHLQLEQRYKLEKEQIENKLKDYKKSIEEAANCYIDTLQEDYKDAEAAHKQYMSKLQVEYNQAAADLQNLKETRQAAYEAILKEQEIKQNKDNYRLLPSISDLQDIHSLERIKQTLHKPRVLSMLIWQTFWQPLAKKQFPLILQGKTKTGIYKITNIQTDQSYIGQSLDIYKRWSDHCKAGLGIDTPVGNKLYQAIQEYGLQNFTFELLCECPNEQLNTKEKFFIELYQSDLFGYNGNKGIK